MTIKQLQKKSIQYRKNILKYIFHANAGHTGGSLSCIDILNVLYNDTMNVSPENFRSPDRDRYIQSKGHSVEALFVVLADKGFFPVKFLDIDRLFELDVIERMNAVAFLVGGRCAKNVRRVLGLTDNV